MILSEKSATFRDHALALCAAMLLFCNRRDRPENAVVPDQNLPRKVALSSMAGSRLVHMVR
jgi:hypothetical protein